MVFVCLFILFDALTLLVSQRNGMRPVKHTAVTVPGGSHFGDTRSCRIILQFGIQAIYVYHAATRVLGYII